MKNTFVKSKKHVLLAGLLYCAAGMITVQADTFVTFSVDMATNIANGTFNPPPGGTDTAFVQGSWNGWSSQFPLVQEGSSTVWTNTMDIMTNGVNIFYKFGDTQTTYEGTSDGGNRGALLPSTSGTSLILPTPYFSDDGALITYTNTLTFQVDMSQQTNLALFDPSTQTVDVKGNFDGWASSAPLVLDPSQNTGLIYTNTFPVSSAVSTNAHMAYGFEITGGAYENLGTSTNSDNPPGGNRFFTMTNSPTGNITFPVAFFSDQPFVATIVSNITFSVDMTIVQLTDTNFNPASLTINGDLMGWGGTSCTNNPSAANTNIYTCTATYNASPGLTVNYQYRYTWKSAPLTTIYDHANGYANPNSQANHTYVVANTNPNGTNVLISFNDAPPDAIYDYLAAPVPVRFSVNMMKNGVYVTGTDGHQFNPSLDNVYINGTFAGWYAWAPGSPNPAPPEPAYQMIESNLSSIYTNTIMVPGGQSPQVTYKYGMDPGAIYGAPEDDEAGFALNHVRVVRSTAMGVYNMALDTFGNQYNEPYFSVSSNSAAFLTTGPASGGNVPVTWLGRPGLRLQTKSSLSSGSWLTLTNTDGTNWTIGSFSTNGFVSQTNYPTASGTTYFRLIKP